MKKNIFILLITVLSFSIMYSLEGNLIAGNDGAYKECQKKCRTIRDQCHKGAGTSYAAHQKCNKDAMDCQRACNRKYGK